MPCNIWKKQFPEADKKQILDTKQIISKQPGTLNHKNKKINKT